MDLLTNDDQNAIAESARALVQKLSPLGSPDRDALWSAGADQGWFALSTAEDLGGVGLGLAEETLVLEALGREAAPGPYVGTLLAAHLAAGAGDQVLLDRVLAGEARAALVVDGTSVDSADVDLLVLLREDVAELVEASGVSARVELSADPAAAIVTWDVPTSGGRPRAVLWDRAAVLTAAALAGIAAAARDQSAAYARTRRQFGSEIGAFQAVKHRCADAAVRADAARQLVTLAALSVDAGSADASVLAASALHVAADHAIRNAADNIQNHGAFGFTDEATAHLLLKRAHTLALSLGSAARRRGRVLG